MISRLTLLIPVALIATTAFAHAVELKDITFTTKDVGKVVFSHKSHMGKKTRTTPNFSCKTCHESSKLNTRHYTMAEMEKGKSCGACHNGKGAFKIGECVKCHPVKEKTYPVKDAGDVLFSHKFHIGIYSCAECHPRLYLPGKGNVSISMAGMETQKSCGACHDGKSAFTVKENCEKCHKS